MTFQGMEYVYAVYQERSFSRAAEKLFISQPSLSANVKRVETQIGQPIFDRSTKPLGLTECGREYIRTVEKIMALQNDFATYLNDWGNLQTGSLTIGGSNLYSSWLLPPLIADFSKQYPKVKVNLIEEGTVKLSQMILSGQIDLMMDNLELPKEEFDRRRYQREELILAVPAHFEINRELKAYQIPKAHFSTEYEPVPLAAFAESPFVLLKQENDTGKRAKQICRDAGFEPSVIFEMDQQMSAYNVTCSGLGISFVGSKLIDRIPENRSVVYYRLPGEVCMRDISFYWKRGRYHSRAMEEFLKLACR